MSCSSFGAPRPEFRTPFLSRPLCSMQNCVKFNAFGNEFVTTFIVVLLQHGDIAAAASPLLSPNAFTLRFSRHFPPLFGRVFVMPQ